MSDAVDVGRAVPHQAVAVTAEIRDCDVITSYHKEVLFLSGLSFLRHLSPYLIFEVPEPLLICIQTSSSGCRVRPGRNPEWLRDLHSESWSSIRSFSGAILVVKTRRSHGGGRFLP